MILPFDKSEWNPSVDRPLLAKLLPLFTSATPEAAEWAATRARVWKSGFLESQRSGGPGSFGAWNPGTNYRIYAGNRVFKVERMSGAELIERAITHELLTPSFLDVPRRWAVPHALCPTCGADGSHCHRCRGLGLMEEAIKPAPVLDLAFHVLSLGAARILELEALAEEAARQMQPFGVPPFAGVVWSCAPLPMRAGRAIWRHSDRTRSLFLYPEGSLHEKPSGSPQTFPLDYNTALAAIWRLGCAARGLSLDGVVRLAVPPLYELPKGGP